MYLVGFSAELAVERTFLFIQFSWCPSKSELDVLLIKRSVFIIRGPIYLPTRYIAVSCKGQQVNTQHQKLTFEAAPGQEPSPRPSEGRWRMSTPQSRPASWQRPNESAVAAAAVLSLSTNISAQCSRYYREREYIACGEDQIALQ